MIPYSEQPKVEILYKLFSNKQYKQDKSHVLPNSNFALDPLLQAPKQEFVCDYIVEKQPFILSGPEYNNL